MSGEQQLQIQLSESVKLSVSALSSDRPLPPRNLTVTSIKAEACYLHWEAPLDNGGSELTNYIVEKKEVVKEEPVLEEGEEAPPEPQWEEVTNSIIERKYGARIHRFHHWDV